MSGLGGFGSRFGQGQLDSHAGASGCVSGWSKPALSLPSILPLSFSAGVLKMFEIPAGARHLQIEEMEPASHSIGEHAVVHLSLHPLPLSQPYSENSHPKGLIWVIPVLQRQ